MEKIQQLKEQIKLLEQQELEKKIAEEKKDDIDYNLGVLNKMISNIIKNQASCRNLDLGLVSGECNQLYKLVSKMLRIMVHMNKDISKLKNLKQTYNIVL